MNNKKKMVLGAAFIVAIMALAGVGYAAFSDQYTGTTKSATSNYDVDYVVVSVGTDGYTPKTDLYITYNTSTVSGSTPVTTYTWVGSTNVAYDVIITVPTQYTTNNQDRDTFKLTAATESSVVSGYKLQYKIGAEGTWTNYGTGDLSTGLVVATSGDTDTVSIAWRAVPNSESITTQEGNVDVGTSVPADDGGKVILPVIVYTVTATQNGVSVSP